MSNPSEPLLKWLREIIGKKKLNSSGLSDLTKISKPHMRKILVGSEPMTVDELLSICDALNVTPSDMGLGDSSVPNVPEEIENNRHTWHLDPLGNHPRQLFEMGFALGCDFLFLVAADQLEDSQIPEAVRKKHAGRNMAIRLDAAYHQYNEPEYYDEGIQLTLSFDALYRCRFSWDHIGQFVFYPDPTGDTPRPVAEPDPTPDDPPKKAGHLRLVK